jgi:hypothetical protein
MNDVIGRKSLRQFVSVFRETSSENCANNSFICCPKLNIETAVSDLFRNFNLEDHSTSPVEWNESSIFYPVKKADFQIILSNTRRMRQMC